MYGDEFSAIVDVQVFGESMDLHGAPCRVRYRVLVALHAYHAVARQAPLHTQHRGVRMHGHRLERFSLLGERFVDPPPGRAMHALVGHRRAPVPELGIQIVQVGELGAEEEVLAHVAQHPLDFALGEGCQLQPIRTVSSSLYASPIPSIRYSGVASSC